MMFGEEEAADLLQSLHRAARKMARRTRRMREATGPDERNHDPVTSMAAMNPERHGRGKEGGQGSESCGSLKAWPNSSTHLCRFMAQKRFFRLLVDAFGHVCVLTRTEAESGAPCGQGGVIKVKRDPVKSSAPIRAHPAASPLLSDTVLCILFSVQPVGGSVSAACCLVVQLHKPNLWPQQI